MRMVVQASQYLHAACRGADMKASDETLGPVILGAAVGGLLGLWISGVLLALLLAIVGGIALPVVLRMVR